ncbi:MAG TPA: hypothetical protein VGM39_19685 [Kofleriaceae bacterium]|jgi:hypothetical protein
MSDPRRTQQLATAHRPSSPDALTKPHVVARPSSDGVPRPIESPLRAPAPPPANSLTAVRATTQFAQGSSEHVRPLMANEAAQTMQFTAAVTKPMAANALSDDDFAEHRAERTSTDLIARSAAILQCVPQHAIYDSYETSITGGVPSLAPASRNAPLAMAPKPPHATAPKNASQITAQPPPPLEMAPKNASQIAAQSAPLEVAPQDASPATAQPGSARFVDDASTRLRAKQSPAAVATGVMRPNARVVFPAMEAAHLANGTAPPTTTSAPGRGGTLLPSPAPVRIGTLAPEPGTPFVAAQGLPSDQQVLGADPSSAQRPASNPAARTVIEPQPILAAARPPFPLPAPTSASGPNAFAAGSIAPSNVATQFERPGAPSNAASPFARPVASSNAVTQFDRPGSPRAKSPSDRSTDIVSLRDEKSRMPLGRDSSADVQRAVQAALDKRRAHIADSVRDARATSGLATGANEESTVLVSPLTPARSFTSNARGPVMTLNAPRSYEHEAKTARLYMLLAVLTCVLAPVAWIHAEEQLMRSNALVFRIERAIGLALTLVAVSVIACGITVLAVR